MQINPFEQKVRIYPCKNESLSLMKWYNKKTEAVLSNRSNDFRGVQSVSDVIRTHDLPLRRRTLYPAELQKHIQLWTFTGFLNLLKLLGKFLTETFFRFRRKEHVCIHTFRLLKNRFLIYLITSRTGTQISFPEIF